MGYRQPGQAMFALPSRVAERMMLLVLLTNSIRDWNPSITGFGHQIPKYLLYEACEMISSLEDPMDDDEYYMLMTKLV